MKNSSSLWILLIGRAICINRGHLEALCLSMRICVCAYTRYVGVHVCVYLGWAQFCIHLPEGLMDSKLYQLLSSKQPNKLLKNDKDIWITLAAERNLTAATKTYQHILSRIPLTDNTGTCSWMGTARWRYVRSMGRRARVSLIGRELIHVYLWLWRPKAEFISIDLLSVNPAVAFQTNIAA